MERSLFRYIWRHSKRDQIIVCLVVLASLPFYFASLDLPRRIVNEAIQGRAFEGGQTSARFLTIDFEWPSWLGGGRLALFEGFEVDRVGLLFGLSGLFLFFVLVNGGFKYWINVAKGALGERMLRRMRFELFSLVLRFTPEALRQVKASETATIVKDEVEPIGNFIGDAFILPAFLGTQAATALIFILVQNLWLGLVAASVVAIQFLVIPRMRRELLRLGRMRQLASRRLAGRIGEAVDGSEAISVHNAEAWERAEIGHRLFELFDIRLRIYKRKFMVKFLNNLLAQTTPFLFYAIGGYFALQGTLDIGQLVAVIAAYRELPPPLKELIDWDQQRLDVQVKYDQVVRHFLPERLAALDSEAAGAADDIRLEGPLVVEELTVTDSHGQRLISEANLTCPLPARIGLIGDRGPAAGVFARVLARRMRDYAGSVRIGEHEIAQLPKAVLGRRMSYAGVEPILFPGSIRDNVVYGLRHAPLEPASDRDKAEAERRRLEALRTGNPVESIDDRWIDYDLAGVSSPDDLDGRILELLQGFGMEEDVYRFGLSGLVEPDRDPELSGRLIEARTQLRARLAEAGMADLVEPFDPERYNTQATVAENLLFGVPTSRDLVGRSLAEHRGFREALAEEGLLDDLTAMGARIAETMTEIFRGLPSGHPLFEQFSFIGADELAEFEAILRRQGRRGRGGPTRDDRTRLLGLPLAYIEPRHRLGLLDDATRARIVAARRSVRAALEQPGQPLVEVYDPDRVCAAAPLRDNLLFGRVNHSAADAQAQVTAAITAVIDEMNLRRAVERVGLDHQVGPSGRMLAAPQRASVNLARCIIKRPDVFVVDGALAPYGEARAPALLGFLLVACEDRTVVVTLPNDREAARFDAIVRFHEGKATLERQRERAGEPATGEVPAEDRIEAPAGARRRVAGGVP